MEFYGHKVPDDLIVGYSAMYSKQKTDTTGTLIFYFDIYLLHYPVRIESPTYSMYFDAGEVRAEAKKFKDTYFALTKEIDHLLLLRGQP